MKYIKVDSCRHCSLHYNLMGDIKYNYYCSHPSNEGMEIENIDIIDLDCQLEDLKEE